MAYPSPRRLQLRRGNASAISSYLGYAGELVVDTTNWTLYVHDGVTVGGYAATVNTASITGNINSILNGTALFGNVIPSANTVYSLGNITHQWKSLFVSNSTIYVGGVPLSIDNTGNLTVNGNTIPTLAYVNTAVANVTVDLTNYALNANVTAANVGLKGYVDQANTIQSAQISSANIGMKGYVDQQITDLIGGAPSILDTLNEIAASINDDANVYTSLTNSIATANTALKGYVDQANTIQSTAITEANLGLKGYVDSQSFYSNAKVAAYLPTYSGNITANYFIGYTQGLVGSITNLDSLNFSVENISALVAGNGVNIGAGGNNNLIVLPAEIIIQNVPLSVTSNIIFSDASQQTTAWTGTVDYANVTNAYSNVQVGVYTNLSTYAYAANVTAANVGMKGYVDSLSLTYSNVQVATYLPTYTGVLAGGSLSLAGTDGTTVVDFQTGAATNQIITLSSDYTFSVKAGAGASNRGHLVLESGQNSRVKINGNGSNVLITAGNGTQSSTWIFANSGVLTFPDGTTQSTAGGGGGSGYSNVNVASYLSTATITTTGNITAQNLTGNITITGNVTGTSANVTLQAGSYSSTFDNQGNVLLPSAYVTANVTANYFLGNGALLTGIVAGSSYSNVQVATYLPTYTGVVTASNVAVAGNVTAQYLFGNGSQLTGIVAGSSYSNVQVATYLPTYSGNIANIRLGVSGVLTFADGTTLATASAISGSTYGNGNVASYLITNGYVNTNSAYANGNVASYLITNQYINANSAYGNGNVTSYLPTHSGNVGVNNLIGTTPNVTLVANSYSTTYDIYGNVAFGNAAYPVQIYATGSITTNSNLTVGSMGVVMPNRPAFRVNGTAAPITTANVNLKGSAITTVFNQGSYFDATTGKFTAPIAGIYEVLLNARVGSLNGLSQIAVLKNGNNSQGNIVCFWEIGSTAGTANHFGVSGTINLVAGDYLSANILAGNISFDGNDNWCVTYLG